ncbi:MAG: archease [Candidatus Humimicrobiaceae bacterium]
MLLSDNKKNFIKYETIEHLSDTKIKAYGKNMNELFENAAEGMFSAITDLDNVKKTVKKEIEVNMEGKVDYECLLIVWLEKLLYFCEVDSLIFSYFKIRNLKNIGNKNTISAIVKGEKINLKKHEILLQIKAPTYHDLRIRQDKKTGIYNAEIIFDV